MPPVEKDFILRGPELMDIPQESTLGRIIFHYLRSRKEDDVAIVDHITNEVVKYGEILQNSVQLADSLRKQGIKRDDVITIISENSLEYGIPVLAGMLIAAVVNPINPAYTPREIEHALSISKPKIAFVSENALNNLLAVKQKMPYLEKIVLFGKSLNGFVSMEQFKSIGSSDINSFELEDVSPGQDAFILLSSGTTGFPKGVLLTQKNFHAALQFFGNVNYVGPLDKSTTVMFLPFFHIFGLYTLLSGILFGMKIVLIKRFKPDIFLRAIEKHKANILYLVPSILLFLAKSDLLDTYDISCVKDILCGAAPVTADLQRAAEIRLQCPVRQIYGMTELSGAAIGMPLRFSKPGSSGKVVSGVVAKVWDVENKRTVGPNQFGELCFKGPGVMKGYIGNEEATRDIIDDDGFLHSGDIGYYDEEGFFYVVERIKELIKYKGFQVAPAELESILLTHKGVKEVAVIGVPDEKAGELPLAFVVKDNACQITEEELIDLIAKNVSVQKRLYGGVKFVNSLPKNPSGKISRKDLRQIIRDSQPEILN